MYPKRYSEHIPEYPKWFVLPVFFSTPRAFGVVFAQLDGLSVLLVQINYNTQVGSSLEHLAKMPIVTTVLAKGHDVLLCPDEVDEFCFMAMMDYNETPLKNVSSENLGLTTEEEKKEAEEATEKNAGLFDAMTDALAGKVEKVVVSTRVSDAPAVLTCEGPVSLQMAATMKAQMGDAAEGMPPIPGVLEMNPKHVVFEVLQKAQAAGDTDKVASYASILYDQAMLVEGLPIDDPVAFAQKVADLMK